jgi:hypothetical protein
MGLRKSGHFEQKFIGARLASFHELDAAFFASKIEALSVGPFRPVVDVMSLGKAMRMSLKTEDGKAQLARDVLDGKLEIVGSTGKTLCDLLLERREVLAAVERFRREAYGDAVSPTEAANQLECSVEVIESLVELGLLSGKKVPMGIRVSTESIKSFSGQYRSVASLARANRTSSSKIVRSLNAHGIKLLSVERRRDKSIQSFIPLASSTLTSWLESQPWGGAKL